MDPYKVLGVSPDDDEETIKKAYRDLVKKYHPDKYVNNPLADLAGEKIKEINKAYDMIMNKHTGAAGTDSASSYSSGYGAGGYSVSFQSARMLISSNRLAEASAMLDSLPRTAEWYYLTGLINLRRGWYSSAVENIRRAADMDPGNAEYSETLNNINERNARYQRTAANNSGCCANDCCASGCCWGPVICLPCCC